MIIIIVFLLIASTDMFDGLVARTFHLESEYGRLLDPVADMSFGFFTLMALCFSNPLAIVLMLLTVLRQLHLFWLFNKSKSVSNLAVVLSGKAKTVAVIVAVVFMLIPQGFVWQGFTTSAIIIAGVLIIVSWLDYWRKYDNSI
jgi:phosphatidylglycerophosphate synthase